MLRRAFILASLLPLSSGCAVALPALQHVTRQKEIQKSHAAENPKTEQARAVFRQLGGLTVGYEQSQAIHVGWIAAPTLNAIAAGSGHFAVTEGILSIDNRCLLWGIVAHELAHDQLDHPAQQLRAQMAVGALSTAAGFIPIAGALGAPLIVGLAGQAGVLAYSRSQEADADARAVEILTRANLPPWSLRYALEFLRDVSGETGGGWFASHPLTAERIASQPPIGETVAILCPGPDVRAAQVAQARSAIETWIAAETERRKKAERENIEDNEGATCRANRTC